MPKYTPDCGYNMPRKLDNYIKTEYSPSTSTVTPHTLPLPWETIVPHCRGCTSTETPPACTVRHCHLALT